MQPENHTCKEESTFSTPPCLGSMLLFGNESEIIHFCTHFLGKTFQDLRNSPISLRDTNEPPTVGITTDDLVFSSLGMV